MRAVRLLKPVFRNGASASPLRGRVECRVDHAEVEISASGLEKLAHPVMGKAEDALEIPARRHLVQCHHLIA